MVDQWEEINTSNLERAAARHDRLEVISARLLGTAIRLALSEGNVVAEEAWRLGLDNVLEAFGPFLKDHFSFLEICILIVGLLQFTPRKHQLPNDVSLGHTNRGPMSSDGSPDVGQIEWLMDDRSWALTTFLRALAQFLQYHTAKFLPQASRVVDCSISPVE